MIRAGVYIYIYWERLLPRHPFKLRSPVCHGFQRVSHLIRVVSLNSSFSEMVDRRPSITFSFPGAGLIDQSDVTRAHIIIAEFSPRDCEYSQINSWLRASPEIDVFPRLPYPLRHGQNPVWYPGQSRPLAWDQQ